MITLKEYEIYLKIKKFIEAENCDENDIIPRLINEVGIIPPYIIESGDMDQLNITVYRLLLEDVEFLSKWWFMPIGIGVRE